MIKRIIALVVLLLISFIGFSFVARTLGIFVPSYDEYGDIANGFDLISAVPAFAICYLLEGFIAVKFKEESKEYAHRRYKKEAFVFIALYFVAAVLFLFFRELDLSIRLSGVLCSLPVWGYALFVFYGTALASPEERAKKQADKYPIIAQLIADARQIGLEGGYISKLVEQADAIKAKATNPPENSFWFLANTIIPELTHGHNHVYRGVLSPHGNHLQNCFSRLVSLGETRNILTQEEAKNMRANVRLEIMEVG